MSDLSSKMFSMQQLFYHFFNNTWYYGNENTDLVWAMMSSEERKTFKINNREYDWDKVFFNHIYGIRRYYFREDILAPEAEMQ